MPSVESPTLPVGSKRLDNLRPLTRHYEHVWQAGSVTTTNPQIRDASKEPCDLGGPVAHALVLEPSPPTIDDGEWVITRWFVDCSRAGRSPGVTRRYPVHSSPTRPIHHRSSPAPSKRKIQVALDPRPVKSPFFGDDRQIRVQGTTLVDQRAGLVRPQPITTLQAATDFLGTTIDIETAPVDPSRPQLRPGNFDPTIEIGDYNHHGSYGTSPGDEAIPEHYLCPSVWWPDRVNADPTDSAWDTPAFTGAIFKFADFDEDDPARVAAPFFASAREMVTQ
jgi:hypothetical protein